ncbi:MAG: sigma 54-interacting transcriptional regulator [Deltaproteobacteria bacterium]|jgi:Nif-specific regulatory protein|nr:sigma 54-interacting transcriptional regulator [Deltaproteobacteria bacterium]MBW2535310.1 sigma 54-interacting transcriptional regulator [Deltaproteobacteria bacterium]
MLLEVTAGDSPGRQFQLDGSVVLIGRSPTNDVVLGDAVVSGRHARIVQGLDGASIEDLGSTNGTAVLRGGQRIVSAEPGDAVPLEDGDVIELGSEDQICQLKVLLDDAAARAHLVTVKPVDELEPTADRLRSDPRTLQALYDTQRRIGRAGDLGSILEAIAAVVFDLVPHGTHVTVVLRAAEDGPTPGGEVPARRARVRGAGSYLPVLTKARPDVADETDRSPFVPVTRSVYRKVLEERTAVLAADAPKDVGRSKSIMSASVRSTIAVPLWRGDDILGVVQVDNRDAPGMLNERDLDVMLVVAEHASLAVANARLIQRLVVAEETLRNENRFLKEREESRRGGSPRRGIVGESKAMQDLLAQLDRVVDTNVTVLIEGETGTGKELIASAIHYRSRRRKELFVAQNCAALTESLLESELFGHKKGSFTGAIDDKKGLFELADGGTLFLDEITEAPPTIQSKLLRALQEGEIRPVGGSEPRLVNVRVVAATNRDLDAEVQAGRFREDLYYRLKVFPLRVPPLRERRGDIALLVEHFLERYAGEFGKPVAGIATEALQLLVAYDWPGNVRQLQNEVQRLVIEADPGAFISGEHVSPKIRRGEQLVARAGGKKGTLKETVAAVERYVILEALREHDGNKTSAAKALGITREGLHKKLKALGA